MKHSPPHVLALLSGGLDSILAAKLIQEQGVGVTCLHFYTPFFGKPHLIPHWEAIYGLSIQGIDLGEAFVAMLVKRPERGFGSVLNPCVDCKILMLRHARALMEQYGACAIISGEVLGQRPMSQRRDTLQIIRREADVKDYLLRPLTAQHLDPTWAEREGYIDRSRLLGISGRGRTPQMALAEHFKLQEIPTPAGGCRLAERENARTYWPVLRYIPTPHASDFYLANIGRQFWHWENGIGRLVIGRNQADNDALMARADSADYLFKVKDFPGPIALARFTASPPPDLIAAAAAFMATYSPKAVASAVDAVSVRVHQGHLDTPGEEILVQPTRETTPAWIEYSWETANSEIRDEAKSAAKRKHPGGWKEREITEKD